MNLRRLTILIAALVLVISTFAGVVQALGSGTTEAAAETVATENAAPSVALRNVRDYAAAPEAYGTNYAIDGGALFTGGPDLWQYVETPEGVIVNAVAIDAAAPQTVYIGAANELAIYRATNVDGNVDGETEWLRIPLNEQVAGGVTDIAIDGAQRILYVGTDTDGLYRLRDVGSSVTLSGHLLLDEPVEEVVTDSTGAALAFARTPWKLYQAHDFGLSWAEVADLHSVPTALAISEAADGTPVALVGTVDRGVPAHERRPDVVDGQRGAGPDARHASLRRSARGRSGAAADCLCGDELRTRQHHAPQHPLQRGDGQRGWQCSWQCGWQCGRYGAGLGHA